MSASLVRRGLELLEAPGGPAGTGGCRGRERVIPSLSNPVPLLDSGQGKAPVGLQRGRDVPRAARAARRRKAAQEPRRNKATVKGRVVKSAIEEYHKKADVNHLKANLQYMLKGRIVANKAITEQV
ncbi:AROS regulator, partial [Ceuthmochares aereus]|nr:AROS regulator [Ceuthmochares aereus]